MGKKESAARQKVIEKTRELFEVSEVYKTCRTNIIVSMKEEQEKIIVVSSPRPEEGKSFVAASLAICFAETGQRVLLIDGNLRKPSLHTIFQSDAQYALEDVLDGTCEAEEATGKTQYDNLNFMGIRGIPDNPTEIIGSDNMRRLLREVNERYSYVFIDTAPVNDVTDTVVLASLAPHIILTVKELKTKHKDVKKALERLSIVRAQIIGVILNESKSEKPKKSKKQGYGSKKGK